MKSQHTIAQSTLKDVPALVALINSAYRGEGSKKGWTTEADLLEGDLRTDEYSLQALMQNNGATFLQATDENGNMKGCVYLQQIDNKLYLGMLTVSPELQGKGTGTELLDAAKAHASKLGLKSIFMNVISVRPELIAWYERQGFRDTGDRKPFPVDQKFGRPTRPLEFMIMEYLM